MENLLKQKYKLPKSAARSIVAEAKALLKIKHDVMFSKPLELKCVAIAESRGFLENGKRVEKKPQRTTWIPSQPTMKADNLRSRVTQILAQPESPTRCSHRPVLQSSPTRSSRPIVSRSSSDRSCSSNRSDSSSSSSGMHPSSRHTSSSHDRKLIKPAGKTSSSERPRRSRFVPSARVTRVLDPIVEASCSTDDESCGSISERPVRRRVRRNPSSDTQTTASESGTSTMTVLMPLRDHIMSILGDCTELDVVSDHAKGFRFTDFDSRSYTSLTVSTDGESVSSGGSSLRGSPRKTCDSPRKSVSMGSAEVKSFAMRFDSDGGACMVSAPPRPRRRNSNEDAERQRETPIRVLNEPPIGVIVTPARICAGF